MFDIAVQNWSTTSTFVLDSNLSYHDKLVAIVNNVVAKSKVQWQQVVKDRKMCIVNGMGNVYGYPKVITGLFDAPMNYDEVMRVSINKLVTKKIISSPDYWMENADSTIPCNGVYCALLLMNASKKSNLRDAVDYLVGIKVISTPSLWLTNAVDGKTIMGSAVKALINNLSSKL
jgi:hypothetical protein